MRIQLKNHHLIALIPFLRSIKLKGERSRARSKFLGLALEAYAALHESEVDLLREYAVLDGKGNPKAAVDGSFSLREESVQEYLAEREKLFNEVAEIEGGTYTEHLKLMRRILLEYDDELDGDTAAMYDALCDAFDQAIGDGTPREEGESVHAG